MSIPDNKSIKLDDGRIVDWFPKKAELYLDKSIFIFGGSRSGKTTLIEEILYLCKDKIPNYIVICPKTSARTYSNKLPEICIKEDFTKDMLQKIWKRQEELTQIYTIVNDITNLEKLFMATSDNEETIKVQSIIRLASENVRKIESRNDLSFAEKKSQKAGIEEIKNRTIKEIYKKCIHKYSEVLKMKFKDSVLELTVINYLDINPRLMIVIDDCSEKFRGWMKLFKRNEQNVFESIAFRGRHNFITMIVGAHDDKLIDTEIRKNAHITIYANSQALVASINKPQSGYTKKEIEFATKIAGKIFHGEENGLRTYQKLCYIKDDPHPFKYTVANLYNDFTLGSQTLRKLDDKIPKSVNNIENNSLIKEMLEKKSR